MKKRSLVAALAMLMVSAIVLTSSTYAWFATSTKAQVVGFKSSITNDSSSISISTTATGTYGIQIDKEDLLAVGTNLIPDTYNPVSLGFDSFATNKVPTTISGAITTDQDTNQTLFNAAVDTSTNSENATYTKYEIHVRSSAVGTVKITPTMSASKAFFYCAITDGETYKVYNAETGGRQYNPVITATNGIDNGDYYMTTADKLSNGVDSYNALGNTVTAVEDSVNNAFELVFDGEPNDDGFYYKSIKVYCWAEGNDMSCTGAVTGAELSVDLAFEYIQPATNG